MACGLMVFWHSNHNQGAYKGRSFNMTSHRTWPMGETQTIGAPDFKARCLDRIASRTLTGVTIAKRGRIVGVLSRPFNRSP